MSSRTLAPVLLVACLAAAVALVLAESAGAIHLSFLGSVVLAGG
jgi:hypothetical protein